MTSSEPFRAALAAVSLPADWQVEVILVNPHNLMLIDDISRQLGTEKVSLVVAVREDILGALDKYVAPSEPAGEKPKAKGAAASEESEWEPMVAEQEGFDLGNTQSQEIDSKTIRLVNDTIQAAVDRVVA